MADIDNKEYARQLRENAVIDDYGRIICSPELWEQIASIIEKIPTADVEEVKHGYWKKHPLANGVVCCSECGYARDCRAGNSCPECGAKMDGEIK